MHADFDLSQEVVLVTGGGGILGRQFAHALAEHGARVVLVDRDDEKVQAAAQEVNEYFPRRAMAVVSDVTSLSNWSRIEQRAASTMGPVTVLVNNAAAKSPNFFEPFETFPLKDWNEVMRVNVTGAMLGCQVIGQGMARRRRGCVVNILSIYGVVAPDQRIYEGSKYEGRAINTPAVYSTSKAALWGLTRYLATYWGDQGVRVNAISPGGVFSGQNETFVRRYSARVPMGRMADRHEMCGALVYLVSPAASYVSGQNLVVDGGMSVW
jgi:NAD(P)-dependent dehydrogenase (short-subunit alcohol dehydrogenase family)